MRSPAFLLLTFLSLFPCSLWPGKCCKGRRANAVELSRGMSPPYLLLRSSPRVSLLSSDLLVTLLFLSFVISCSPTFAGSGYRGSLVPVRLISHSLTRLKQERLLSPFFLGAHGVSLAYRCASAESASAASRGRFRSAAFASERMGKRVRPPCAPPLCLLACLRSFVSV